MSGEYYAGGGTHFADVFFGLLQATDGAGSQRSTAGPLGVVTDVSYDASASNAAGDGERPACPQRRHRRNGRKARTANKKQTQPANESPSQDAPTQPTNRGSGPMVEPPNPGSYYYMICHPALDAVILYWTVETAETRAPYKALADLDDKSYELEAGKRFDVPPRLLLLPPAPSNLINEPF
ncbi:hypothetical protein M427DRAFT_39192 [Gonapodya prolifera JEL478]|uniref:Uncharacterized protein n=1 Tax=Gonapodya prolifera (strain JEL478) TaxID=1344416 RepID=A0A138ZXP9_GONPJ|nr:hypothetical protein M427DRAFT_39192 [Gonapodya prolifera JEL478]|eukprot:KXS09264.1 hypothetical protein M427DRAFT_39192 [Gonapodya prolifera JEL478]